MTANGVTISRIANGASCATYDATEQALWSLLVATAAQLVSKLDIGLPAYALAGGYRPAKRYDKARGFYNADATLARSRSKLALAAAGLGHFRIVGMGDSIMAGQGGNPRHDIAPRGPGGDLGIDRTHRGVWHFDHR